MLNVLQISLPTEIEIKSRLDLETRKLTERYCVLTKKYTGNSLVLALGQICQHNCNEEVLVHVFIESEMCT